jgi:hypothetical protein
MKNVSFEKSTGCSSLKLTSSKPTLYKVNGLTGQGKQPFINIRLLAGKKLLPFPHVELENV